MSKKNHDQFKRKKFEREATLIKTKKKKKGMPRLRKFIKKKKKKVTLLPKVERINK